MKVKLSGLKPVSPKKNGQCKIGSRRVKGRRGCWGLKKSSR